MNKMIKNALVTGGSRGIGNGIVLGLAKAGYNVVFSYVSSEEEAEKLKNRVVSEYGVKCEYFRAALQEPDAPKKLVEQAIEFLGSLSCVVNNAGITIFRSVLDMDPEDMQKLIDLDFRGYILTTMYASRHMVENEIQGSIINITSGRAERAYPGDAVYGGVKAGIERACKSMALDLAPYGIRVNCVAPGATRVREPSPFHDYLGPKIPIGRAGTPEDIANAVVWLASEESSYVTGISLRVDGGLILPGMPEGRPKDGEDLGWGFNRKK